MSDEKTRVGLGLLLCRGLSLQLHDNNTRRNKINEGESNELRIVGEEGDWEGAGVERFWGFKGEGLAVFVVFGKGGRCFTELGR